MGIPVINFKFLKRMITQIDDKEVGLNQNSSNKIEAELAKSSAEIDEKFEKYNEHKKAQRKKILDETKVSKEQLNTVSKENSKSSKEQEKQEKEKDDDYTK